MVNLSSRTISVLGTDLVSQTSFDRIFVRLANSKARIKPTAPLSVFDKENSIEFLLNLVHYIYMQSNPNPVLLSHAFLWVNLLSHVCQYYKFAKLWQSSSVLWWFSQF